MRGLGLGAEPEATTLLAWGRPEGRGAPTVGRVVGGPGSSRAWLGGVAEASGLEPGEGAGPEAPALWPRGRAVELRLWFAPVALALEVRESSYLGVLLTAPVLTAVAMSSVSPIQIPSRLPLLLTHESVLLPGSTMRTSVDTARNLQLVRSRLLKGTSLQSTILGVIPNTPDPASDTQDLPPLHR